MSGIGPLLALCFFVIVLAGCTQNNDPLAAYRANVKRRKSRKKRRKR